MKDKIDLTEQIELVDFLIKELEERINWLQQLQSVFIEADEIEKSNASIIKFEKCILTLKKLKIKLRKEN